MIDHVGISVSDIEAAKKAYSVALEPLGYSIFMEVPEKKTVGFAYNCKLFFGLISFPKPDFWITEQAPGPGIHFAFSGTVDQCNKFYEAALSAGFKDNGKPGHRPQYHKNYYGAFVTDPYGNNVEVVCHRA